jgi:tetratricopeptide (TPR) repeat protein
MWFDRLLTLPSAAARTAERAKGLTGAAGIAYWQNEYPAATDWYEEAEAIYRELGDRRGLADALYNTGSMAGIAGDMDKVRAIFGEGSAIAREIGDDQLAMRFLEAEGYMAFMTDDFDTARPRLEEALTLAEKSGDRLAIGAGHHTVGQVARLQGRLVDAADSYRSAIRIAWELGDTVALTEPLQGLAAVLIATGDPERGVRLLGAHEAIREQAGGGPPPEWLRLGDPFSPSREHLGQDRYNAAWQAGRAMSVDQAVADALSEPEPVPPPQ